MKVPDFVIVGAPKCGTTSLYAYLASHPDIFLSPIKEPNYFCLDAPALRFARSPEAYARLFAGAAPGQVAGEASTAYMFSRAAVPAILAANPAAKVVAMVRNPLDMVVSYHAQLVYTFDEDEPNFEAAWRLSELRARGERVGRRCRAPRYLNYKAVGRLGEQVQRLKELVPEQQLHVFVLDDLRADPAGAYGDTLRFLGVRPQERRDFAVANARKAHAWPALARFLMRPPPPLRGVKAALKRAAPARARAVGDAVHRLNQRPEGKHALPAQLKQEIGAEFRDDIALLGRLLDRDLSRWCAAG